MSPTLDANGTGSGNPNPNYDPDAAKDPGNPNYGNRTTPTSFTGIILAK